MIAREEKGVRDEVLVCLMQCKPSISLLIDGVGMERETANLSNSLVRLPLQPKAQLIPFSKSLIPKAHLAC